MSLAVARREFIDGWGQFGSDWGINRTMARIHALLLVSPEPVDTDRVIEELAISRGNANTNLRGLLEWGVVRKVHKPGVRREFFEAEKDLWEVARRVAERRRRRELDPVVRLAERLRETKPARGEDPGEARELTKLMREISDIGRKAGRLLDLVVRLDRNGFFGKILKLLPRV
ncbi:MAG: GbsR/MarR family transcriptional regulator [Planctomycetota bacterium]